MIWIILLVVVAALVVGGVALAVKSKKDYDDSNELIPGQPTNAPSSWAGSHDPEALLHRRIRDALAALRANQAFDDDGSLLDIRVTLEQEAVALDQRLIAIAALTPRLKPEPLARATEAVEAIEETVAASIGVSSAEAAPRLQAALARVKDHTAQVGEAWEQLEAGTATAAPVSTPPPASTAIPEPAPVAAADPAPPPPMTEPTPPPPVQAPPAPPAPPVEVAPPTPEPSSPPPAAPPTPPAPPSPPA